MKQQTYRVTVVFSKSGILACECDCKSGSKGLDKVVCVHVLPVLMQFVVFMFEDLAENILVEFCNRWSATLDVKLSSHLDDIRDHIIQIMDSVGCSNDEIEEAKLSSTIKGMLDSFCVGTEKKKNIPLPPKDDELIPLSQYKSVSTSKSLKNILSKKKKRDHPPTSNSVKSTSITLPKKFPSEPTILKKNEKHQSVLQILVCDFCKIPTKTTSHVCIHEISDGPRIIEGTQIRICGLASCIECKEKFKMEEEEYRTCCPIHCKASTMDFSDHPLLEKMSGIQVEEHEEVEGPTEVVNPSIFLPDYERIKYAFDGISSLYKTRNLCDDLDEDINSYPGIKIFEIRASEAMTTANRRKKFIVREKKSMYKKMRDLMDMAGERIKIRKMRKVTARREVEDDSILEEAGDISNSESFPFEDNFLSLSQDSYNTVSTMSASPPESPSITPSICNFEPSSTDASSNFLLSQPQSLSQLETASLPELPTASISNFASSQPQSHSSHSIPSSTFNKTTATNSITTSSQSSLSPTKPSYFSSASSFDPPTQKSSANISSSTNDSASICNKNNKSKRKNNIRRSLPSIIARNIVNNLPLEESTFMLRRARKDSDRKFSFKCCFPNCENNDKTPGVKFKKVKKKPIQKADMSIPRNVRTYYKHRFHHELLIRRCGLKNKKVTENTRYCSQHSNKKETVKKKVEICGVIEEIEFEYDNIPTSSVFQAQPKTLSVFDRCAVSNLKEFEKKKVDEHGSQEAADELIEWRNKFFGCFSPEALAKQHGISQRVRVQMDIPKFQLGQTSSTIESMLKKDEKKDDSKRKSSSLISNKVVSIAPSVSSTHPLSKQQVSKRHKQRKSPNNIKDLSTPAVVPKAQSCDEIKRKTGFVSEEAMMRFIIIVCNADETLIEETTSNELTWFEEWFLYFEVLWLRSHTRWEDAATLYNTTQISKLRQVFDAKCKIVLDCRSSWPWQALQKEDVILRKKKWGKKYSEFDRIIMWDDTNVPYTFKPSRADNQRLTYSSYYGMNCAKGGVFIQLCGWMGVEPLWVGAISDSYYQIVNKVFERQMALSDKDEYKGRKCRHNNVLDKGYRLTQQAYEWEQECSQPIFAKSDRRFARNETIVSASIAADRSGNERAVNLAKKSGYIKTGLTPGGCPKRLSNAWLAWSFQVNFMYNTVL